MLASSQIVEPLRALMVPPVLLNGAAPIRLMMLPDCARIVPVLFSPAAAGWMLRVPPRGDDDVCTAENVEYSPCCDTQIDNGGPGCADGSTVNDCVEVSVWVFWRRVAAGVPERGALLVRAWRPG